MIIGQKRKSKNTLGKVTAGIGTVGAGAFLARKQLSALGNSVINKIKPPKIPKPIQSIAPKVSQPAALPAKSNQTIRTEKINQGREQELKKQMNSMNATNENIRLRKEAEKAAKRQSNIKRQPNPNAARNRAIIKEAGIQQDQKKMNNIFKDVKENPKDFADLEKSILRSKTPQGFGNSQSQPKKQNKSNKKNKRNR